MVKFPNDRPEGNEYGCRTEIGLNEVHDIQWERSKEGIGNALVDAVVDYALDEIGPEDNTDCKQEGVSH